MIASVNNLLFSIRGERRGSAIKGQGSRFSSSINDCISIQATVRLWLLPRTGSVEIRSIYLRLNAGYSRSAGFISLYTLILNYDRVTCSLLEGLVSGLKMCYRSITWLLPTSLDRLKLVFSRCWTFRSRGYLKTGRGADWASDRNR